MPTAIDIDPHYSDELWVKDCRFEDISGAAVIISNEKSPLTEIGFENAVLKDAPTFALFRESGKNVAGKGAIYRVRNFNYGLIVPGEGMTGAIGMRYDAAALSALPAPLPPAIPRAAAHRRLGQRPHARRHRATDSRRHRRDPEGHRHASSALFSQRALSRQRHAHA